MALQSSGPIDISDIQAELGSTSGSLRTLSAAAGFTSPDAMSEFYGYSSAVEPDEFFNVSNWKGNGGTKDIIGKIGQSGEFNGNSSRVDTGYNFGTDSSYSVSVWAKTSRTNYRQSIFGVIDSAGSGSTAQVEFGIYSNNNFEFWIANGTTGWTNNSVSASSYLDGNWHHYVLVVDGTSVKLYADGNIFPIANLTSTVSAGTASSDNLVIGRFGDYPNQQTGSNLVYWDGGIDQVRIFNKALSSFEAITVYAESPATTSTTDVLGDGSGVALYEFEGNADDTGGTYNGTPLNLGFVGMKFQPDLVWIKGIDNTWDHLVFDVARGGNKYLKANETNVESGVASWISYPSGGFKLTNVGGAVNQNGEKFVSYNFKAGGSTVSNTSGTITSQVSANQAAGFSIVKWTGTGVNGKTIGHGLSSAPEIIITKGLSNPTSWVVGIGNISGYAVNDYLTLNTTNQKFNSSTFYQTYGASTFKVGVSSANEMNKNSSNSYISYVFHSVPGLSKIGTYVGNGSLTGPTVTTGFKPRFLILKQTSYASHWYLMDAVREAGRNDILYSYTITSSASYASIDGYPGTKLIQLNSNGFQLKTNSTSFNGNGRSYIYYAIA